MDIDRITALDSLRRHYHSEQEGLLDARNRIQNHLHRVGLLEVLVGLVSELHETKLAPEERTIQLTEEQVTAKWESLYCVLDTLKDAFKPGEARGYATLAGVLLDFDPLETCPKLFVE